MFKKFFLPLFLILFNCFVYYEYDTDTLYRVIGAELILLFVFFNIYDYQEKVVEMPVRINKIKYYMELRGGPASALYFCVILIFTNLKNNEELKSEDSRLAKSCSNTSDELEEYLYSINLDKKIAELSKKEIKDSIENKKFNAKVKISYKKFFLKKEYKIDNIAISKLDSEEIN